MTKVRKVLGFFFKTASCTLLKLQWNNTHLFAKQLCFWNHWHEVDVDTFEQRTDRATQVLSKRIKVVSVVVRVLLAC